ncbi:HtaA domain-containing protein [Janibacter limosus]|uniref:HtaA domain-containing protein n=1 Tax=Janibacter limosus TaxID=53458 RepID=UPI000831D0E8|nr:HtaA domain-containing protein [Janibacter limosus]
MSRSPSSTRHRAALAGLLTAAVPAALLLTSPGAHAAPSAPPTFTWKVSQQFVDHFAKAGYNQNTFVASDGASLTADSATVFGDGAGWANPTTGDASLQYAGTITGSFVVGAPQYSIAISDPAITIKDGAGQVTADVAWTVPSDSANPSGGADDVVVTTFNATASDWSDGALTATPDWSTQSFAPEFMDALNPGLQPHFRTTGGSSDAKKAPAPFTALAAAPAATTTVTQEDDGAAEVAVAGTGYQPGGLGIYVGVTQAGPINPADAEAYLGTQWVNGSQIAADGSFSTTLALTAEEVAGLDPEASYEVHTMKAHGQAASDPSQNVRIPIELVIPATDEPGTDEPGTDEPVTEEPVTEEPVTEEPATEEPTVEEPATEEPVSEEPAIETPATTTPPTQAPAAAAPEVPQVVQTDGIGGPAGSATPALGAVLVGLLVGAAVGIRRRLAGEH